MKLWSKKIHQGREDRDQIDFLKSYERTKEVETLSKIYEIRVKGVRLRIELLEVTSFIIF